METVKRKIKNGFEYDPLFPKARGGTKVIKRDANVSDTVHFIPKVVGGTLFQTAEIANKLKGNSLYETCNNIWLFVYRHINYEKDAHGLEQVRSPARTWADRQEGVDCDCYTTFISSILTNLKIPHSLRITKYKQDRFQHIYPVIPDRGGGQITMDCVLHEFDTEEPYTEKKDYPMDLEYLDGINDDGQFFDQFSEDELTGETGELGKIKILAKIGTAVKKAAAPLKKVANVVNKVNPATVLLRAGLLASMKLNLMKVAGKLRWAYLSEQQAQQKGMIVDKYHKLKQVMTKLENIFYTAGGKPENLKQAILTGKGNQDKQVLAGLGTIEIQIEEGMSHYTPLAVLLGTDMYNEESAEGLGEPVTGAAITAASAALATIAALIKNIGNLFHPGNKLNESGGEEGSPGESVDIPSDSVPSSAAAITESSSNSAQTIITSDTQATSESSAGSSEVKEGFWDKNKNWLKPTLWGAGGLTVLYLGYKALAEPKPKPKPAVSGLEGAKKKSGRPPGKAKNKQTPIALM